MSFNFERKIKVFFPINKQLLVFCLIFVLFSAFMAPAQSKQQRYLDYIDRYKTVALQHEREYGVPASITLAQGILESSVGQSKMAQEANNHFGIKAYHWSGEVYGGDKGPRYSVLYELDVTDYRSWAQGLRDCGYAEDVNYPAKLIRIIEQYELYALDGGMRLDSKATATVEVIEEETTTDSGRWHHRKRRNRTTDHQQVQQEQSQENQQPFTPLRQGQVSSSADND